MQLENNRGIRVAIEDSLNNTRLWQTAVWGFVHVAVVVVYAFSVGHVTRMNFVIILLNGTNISPHSLSVCHRTFVSA